MRHIRNLGQFVFGGDDTVIDDDESFLLETDHDLAVVGVVEGWAAAVGVAVGAAEAGFGVVGEFFGGEEERVGAGGGHGVICPGCVAAFCVRDWLGWRLGG